MLPVLTAILTSGCSTSGCTDNRSSIPLAGFYSSVSHEAISVESMAVSGVGAPNDSLLLAPSAKSSEVYLPLRSDRDEVTFQFSYMWDEVADRGLADYITVGYESFPYFASEECGAMYRYRITYLSHTDVVIDSVAITVPDSIITNINAETIQIYFRTEQ